MRALALALLLSSPALAERPITPPAPEFPPRAAWINAKPMFLRQLRGRKVVIVAFLDLTAVHASRTTRVLKQWFDRYALSQLMVIGVVTPDLEIEKDAAWVRGEIKRQGIDFPIVIDGDRSIWKAYANEGWPSYFLIDRKGRIVYDRLGEGDYAEMEDETRKALEDLIGDLPPRVDAAEPRRKECGHATRDVAMGARGDRAALSLDHDFSKGSRVLVESREGEVSTRGRWDREPDGLRLAQSNADQGSFVRVVYQASQALATLAPAAPGKTTRFFVKADDQWLYEGVAGGDVKIDDDGRSYISVDRERLYDILRDAGDKPHELYLIPERAGAGIYGFSFADSCTVLDKP